MELPTGSVTFLFSDIEGSTRLLDELGSERYAEELATHRRQMRKACGAHGGVEVDTQGDAFFIAFADATSAIAAAAKAQKALAAGPIRVRMGLHSGTPLVTPEGYVGIDVHRGARVMSAGHGGQVLVSEATYRLLDGAAELTDLGLHRLKDLTEPQRLWQLGSREFPPLKTLYQTNLPIQPTPLVGREAELGQVLAMLAESRLVTLTGAGGSGKTRLALQAAAELVESFRDGVWWISLAALRDPELLEPTISQVVRATDGLQEHLRKRRILLLLDNFEQLLEAAPQIAALLADARDLRVLVTSRQRLGIAAEHEYAVPTLLPSEALALFTARARQLKPDFAPDEATGALCVRLDGLPLAIELAAARIKVLDPGQMLARLGHSLELLTSGARDAPERHQTLRATIGWSNDLLTDEERKVFSRLSVFSGGCTLEAAEHVCDANLDALQSLLDKSLLRRTDERFWMLETIHEFARERLEERGETEMLARRHAEYFAAVAQRAEPELIGASGGLWLARLEADHDNLRAARGWLRQVGDGDSEIDLVTAAWHFQMNRGHLTEGRIWLEEALTGPGGLSPQRRTKALFGASILAVWQGAYERARSLAEENLALARSLGDPHSVACALDALAVAVQGLGEHAKATSLFEECRKLSRETGDDWLLSIATNNLGDLALNEGAYERAAGLFEESLALGRKRGDAERIVRSLANLASANLELGRDQNARALLNESLEHSARAGLVEVAALVLDAVAALAAAEREPQRAATLAAKAAAVYEELAARRPPFEQTRNDRILEMARERLGRDAFSAAWAEGAAMSLEEAVDYALGRDTLGDDHPIPPSSLPGTPATTGVG